MDMTKNMVPGINFYDFHVFWEGTSYTMNISHLIAINRNMAVIWTRRKILYQLLWLSWFLGGYILVYGYHIPEFFILYQALTTRESSWVSLLRQTILTSNGCIPRKTTFPNWRRANTPGAITLWLASPLVLILSTARAWYVQATASLSPVSPLSLKKTPTITFVNLPGSCLLSSNIPV